MTETLPLTRADAPAFPSAGALFGVPWAWLMAGIALGALAPASAEKWGAPLLLASGLCLGMPHGAGDWLILRDASRGRRALWTRAALYLGLAFLVGALWWWRADWALGFFLFLTAWHWGSGDAHWLAAAPATRSWTLFAWGRGLLVMAAPLAFQPQRSALVLRSLASLASQTRFPVESALRWAPAILALALGLTVLAWLTEAAPDRFASSRFASSRFASSRFASSRFSSSRFASSRFASSRFASSRFAQSRFAQSRFASSRFASSRFASSRFAQSRFAQSRLIVVESALLLALFWATPPLFAVTLYFAAVHAWRHVLRVESLEGAPLRNAAQIARAVARFHFQVAPVTVAALLGIAPVLALWPQLRADPLALGTAFLVLISALTLPHAVVVGALDCAGRVAAKPQA